jgi:hypothetical protein
MESIVAQFKTGMGDAGHGEGRWGRGKRIWNNRWEDVSADGKASR